MERAVEAFVKYQTEAEEKFRKWEVECKLELRKRKSYIGEKMKRRM